MKIESTGTDERWFFIMDGKRFVAVVGWRFGCGSGAFCDGWQQGDCRGGVRFVI